ncbi:MAG: type VI secretion system contractile sheath small subunit [Planctomycetota bacterium]
MANPPKERVNIRYKSALGDAKEEVELPFRMLVVGDFTQREDGRQLENREPIDVNKDNFNKVLKEQNVEVNYAVSNTLTGDEGDEIGVSLKFESLDDFKPDRVAQQIPELNRILEVRNALAALKGPLGNDREFRRKLDEVLNNPELVDQFMAALQGGGSAEAPDLSAADAPAPAPAPSDDPPAAPSGDEPSA